MKKSHIILAAVPVVCALGGFGAGTLLHGGEQTIATHQASAPRTPAEGVLHGLADHEGGHDTAPASHIIPDHGDQHSALAGGAMIIRAAYRGEDDNLKSLPPSEANPVEAHRLDPDILAAHANKVVMEKTKAERQKALEAKLAKIEATVDKSTQNPALLPVDVEARIAEDAIKRIAASADHVVKLGRITMPVETAAKTTYYVADFGVAVTDMDQAAYYYEGHNAARLRDQVMQTLHELAPTQLLRSDRVDSDVLAERVSQDLRTHFAGVEDFLFLSLYKTDVPRS